MFGSNIRLNGLESGDQNGDVIREAEAQKDILRWLAIYQRSIDPDYEFSFPAHHPRYKGYCLLQRHWPSGSRWEAFDDSTWERAPIEAQPDRPELEQAIDVLKS